MDVSVHDRGLFEFGPFQLDTGRRRLTRAGTPIKLPAKQFDILLYLLANPHRVIEKDELLAAVWPGRIVEEGNLTQTVFLLRRALQSEGDGSYIITAPGRGYRFVTDVVRLAAGTATTGISFASPVMHERLPAPANRAAEPARPRHPTGVRARQTVAAAFLLVPVLASAWFLMSARVAAPPAQAVFLPPPHSVAVLPFANMSGDAAQDYFSDGLSEELINTLSRIDTLQVAARMSAFTFRNRKATVGEIGRTLNVGTVLDGSVRREGQRLRITIHLNDAVTGFQLWSRSYDRSTTEILALQSDIATTVAGLLKVTLLADTAARLSAGGTTNPLAFDAYVRGAKLMQGISRAGAYAALAAFDEAIRIDPSYADAFAGRSEALSELTHYWDPDFAQNAADADASLQAADRAVALAPASPYAHTVRGEALLKKVDFIHADAEQTLAHRLGPEDALATRGYALMQCMLGHRAEAEAASRHMLELDPLRSRLYHDRAYVQTVDRDYDGALVTIAHERALGVDDQPFIRAYTAWVHLAQNKPEAAAADCRPGCAWPEFNNAVIAHKLGHFAEAQASLDKLHVIAAGKLFYDDAKIYAQWGDAPAALRGLAKAVQSDPYDVRWIRVDESLDPIRQYPAFKKAEDSLNLPP